MTDIKKYRFPSFQQANLTKQLMNINKLLPLTETTFYIIISFLTPSHSYAVMQKMEELSKGRIRIAARTMYGTIKNLRKQKLIQEVSSEDKRRRVYILTQLGKEALSLECERLKQLVSVAEEFVQEDTYHENI